MLNSLTSCASWSYWDAPKYAKSDTFELSKRLKYKYKQNLTCNPLNLAVPTLREKESGKIFLALFLLPKRVILWVNFAR